MAINPVSFTEKVIRNFLRYQLTTYPFADTDLYSQMRRLLSLDESRRTPLFKGPYVSLSRAFSEGAAVKLLVDEKILHPFMQNLIPFTHLYGHQEEAIRSICSGNTTLISTGTGSGKTECFLYPIISRCLELRDQNAPAGICAVLVYPMNALAEDQLLRLRDLLAGMGISFGMYIGKTPESESDVTGRKLPAGSSNEDYKRALKRAQDEKQGGAVHPPEERCSRQAMRTAGEQPRILLTNVKQLELLLTRGKDVELFDNAHLDFLVFDEAHTYGGVQGAETACLIRRLRAFCGRDINETVCVATSATITDPVIGINAGKIFASRFFGVDKNSVKLVTELYRPDLWADKREITQPFPGDVSEHLKAILKSVDKEDSENPELARAFKNATGLAIDEKKWKEDLYKYLSQNEIVYQIADFLKRPRKLSDLLEELSKRIGRHIPEEEVLAWLALGAASRKDDRPLLRPVIHGFVSGIVKASVSFPEDKGHPYLWLSREDETKLYRLPVLTCTTCGQHYFEHYVADFSFTGDIPGGGDAVDERHLWRPLAKESGGRRVILLDRLIGAEEDDDEPSRTSSVYLCRNCGALHSEEVSRCDACGIGGSTVRLMAVQQNENNPGRLTMCISCKARGRWLRGSFREPARPVRATTVADVHVLAQDMVHHSERRRLLVFADNRQDAAFQAGWMRDHARRFRLRSLMSEIIAQGSISIGDLTAQLENVLDNDNPLSMALIPEVWNYRRKESAGTEHGRERQKFLRIQVLRELATGMKERIGLEPWGRLKVEYLGLDSRSDFIQKYASILGISAVELLTGIAGLLDWMRRSLYLHDPEMEIFSRIWQDGDPEIQRGYLPLFKGFPAGLKLHRESGDNTNWVKPFLTSRGSNTIRHAVKSWGIEDDHVNEFIEELWKFLVDETKILIPVTLKGNHGRMLPNCSGTKQIDADKLLITPNRGIWRCNKCRRTQVRPSPHNHCIAFRCDGTLAFESENPDNYDLEILDNRFEMIRPREHSAQVPSGEREVLENIFKSESTSINALVCTPTLELGVDIGALDAVLMRNVPPLPSNYWQRVGRAGRRHRMAVNLTYCRPSSHDRVYFEEPVKMLAGLVEPPKFNMRNEIMVAKHIHSAILTRLNQLARPNSVLSDSDRTELKLALEHVFPLTIKNYLFDESGHVRSELFDVSLLYTVCSKHENDLLKYATESFSQGWPDEDKEVVSEARILGCIREMRNSLEEVIRRLKKRLEWAMDQMRRLDETRRIMATLEPADDALYKRCDELIKRYKGISKRRRVESEGFDDINTYGVLASEGFLPGYGLETGSVLGSAHIPEFVSYTRDFALPRPTSIAIREYVPGNLIYANNNRFVARYFHLEAEQPTFFQVDTANEAVNESRAQQARSGDQPEISTMGGINLRAVAICDVDLAHNSHITDDEDYRFQMPVSVYGYELGRHNGGVSYKWGDRDFQMRQNVHIRLVNVGSTTKIESEGIVGYPVCLVCGQSRSPFSSDTELTQFSQEHQNRCGQPIEPTGFFANIVANSLSLPGCANRDEAYSILEAIRTGASNVLEMEREDLDILVIGHPGTDRVDALLYDPMPGGSGLLVQICQQFSEIHAAALDITANCSASCERGCIDCLWTYYNSYFHRHLDRILARDLLVKWGNRLILSHEIPPVLPTSVSETSTMTTNEAEEILRGMLQRAQFPAPLIHHQINLGKPLGSTSPDFFYPGDDELDPGVCIYLDGLSEHIHGNPTTRQKDQAIRQSLRSKHFLVIEIPASNLYDKNAMKRYFFQLARILLGKEKAKDITENDVWFEMDI